MLKHTNPARLAPDGEVPDPEARQTEYLRRLADRGATPPTNSHKPKKEITNGWNAQPNQEKPEGWNAPPNQEIFEEDDNENDEDWQEYYMSILYRCVKLTSKSIV